MRAFTVVICCASASLLRQQVADEPTPYTEGVYTQCNPGPLKAAAK
eukprot:CAMPEP_0204411948 /NCGR_PEP_ID=MMETSP0470-20130426/11706_1 /ASSEMBLY_ACC=CAM_ASM_000385 /TAXON_ID=2969 /ORGANISM="Oxyrrhis marina" /LENGTH=45 /DNA_ID= /DNA_START= /DNA_END= /DNA_ORIENTATION=